MRCKYVLLTLVLLSTACGTADELDGDTSGEIGHLGAVAGDTIHQELSNAPRVPSGEIAKTGAVLFYDINNGALVCSGQLIRPRWVLTAAHCPLNANHDAVLGNLDCTNCQWGRVQNAYDYPQANPNACRTNPSVTNCMHDVKLVYLSQPIYPTRRDGTLWSDFAIDPSFGVIQGTFNANQEIRVWGYGGTNSSGSGSGFLREGTERVQRVENWFVQASDPSKTWSTDSGAGAFAQVIPANGPVAGGLPDNLTLMGIRSFSRRGTLSQDTDYFATFTYQPVRQWYVNLMY